MNTGLEKYLRGDFVNTEKLQIQNIMSTVYTVLLLCSEWKKFDIVICILYSNEN